MDVPAWQYPCYCMYCFKCMMAYGTKMFQHFNAPEHKAKPMKKPIVSKVSKVELNWLAQSLDLNPHWILLRWTAMQTVNQVFSPNNILCPQKRTCDWIRIHQNPVESFPEESFRAANEGPKTPRYWNEMFNKHILVQWSGCPCTFEYIMYVFLLS